MKLEICQDKERTKCFMFVMEMEDMRDVETVFQEVVTPALDGFTIMIGVIVIKYIGNS